MLKNNLFAEVLASQTPEGEVSPSTSVNASRQRMGEILNRLRHLVVPESLDRIKALDAELNDFRVRVSLVGQVKAGKTQLTNAMIGKPDLLPSDVNPWTSVITNIHLNTAKPHGKNAVFTFFTQKEWDNMINVGGHLGDVAVRANVVDEMDDLKDQIREMQERTEKRLGRNFGMLMNGYHSFLGFTPEMITKYVCLGDDDMKHEGRYADVTKSADLYLDDQYFKLPTVLSDTPGVNDPFLVREAVTLDNLSTADVCVVVLSAHQAFSTVDIGLIRILMALKNEQLVLYVNRIDELQNPDQQIIEIDGYIRGLLEEQNLPNDLPIVFGSAVWGEVATAGRQDHLTGADDPALAAFAEARLSRVEKLKRIPSAPAGQLKNTRYKVTDLSGLHELREVVESKSAKNVAQPFLEDMREQVLDIVNQSILFLDQASQSASPLRPDINISQMIDDLDTILTQADLACSRVARILSEKVLFMMSSAFREFQRREIASLTAHIDAGRAVADWSPDTETLRRDLNIAHDEFVKVAPGEVSGVFTKVGKCVEKIYADILNEDAQLFSVHMATPSEPKAPVSLMRTMSVDLKTGWFGGWFARKVSKNAFIRKFEAITKAEVQTTMVEMQEIYVGAYVRQIRAQLHDFLAEHVTTLQNLSLLGGDDQRVEVRRKLGVDTEIRERLSELEGIVDDLCTLFPEDVVKPSKTQKAS